MKSKIFERIAAFVLVALMAFSIVPVNAFAAGEAGVITFDYCYDSNGNMILYNGETDVDGYLEDFLASRPDLYCDDQIRQRVHRVYEFYQDPGNIRAMYGYLEFPEP